MKQSLHLNVWLKLTREITPIEEKKLRDRLVELLDGCNGIIDDELVDNFRVDIRKPSNVKNKYNLPYTPDSKLKF